MWEGGRGGRGGAGDRRAEGRGQRAEAGGRVVGRVGGRQGEEAGTEGLYIAIFGIL